MKIKAAVTYEKDAPYVIEKVDLAEPKAGEILVKVVASGICHTDEVAQTQQIPVPLPPFWDMRDAVLLKNRRRCHGIQTRRPGGLLICILWAL